MVRRHTVRNTAPRQCGTLEVSVSNREHTRLVSARYNIVVIYPRAITVTRPPQPTAGTVTNQHQAFRTTLGMMLVYSYTSRRRKRPSPLTAATRCSYYLLGLPSAVPSDGRGALFVPGASSCRPPQPSPPRPIPTTPRPSPAAARSCSLRGRL